MTHLDEDKNNLNKYINIIAILIILIVFAYGTSKWLFPPETKYDYSSYTYCVQFTNGFFVVDRSDLGWWCYNQTSGTMSCGWVIENETILHFTDWQNKSKILSNFSCSRLVSSVYVKYTGNNLIDEATKI